MSTETSLGAALKAAVQTMSKKKQTEMIADYVYKKYDVFSRFKPLAIGIDKDLIETLSQFDNVLVSRVLANHCRRPRYIKSLARGGKRFDLNGRFKGEVTAEEQEIAKAHPCMQSEAPKADAAETAPEVAVMDVEAAVEVPAVAEPEANATAETEATAKE
ncbi:MAG: osmoprotectant transport activator ProQ [Neisseriaceae bacterium]|nr:osmoprotectant transport activator ProQ [Neisseriaceae bacterium]MBP6861403.1 osmoprotectant transport activator ProQ [Neisseriaceae bacterium]